MLKVNAFCLYFMKDGAKRLLNFWHFRQFRHFRHFYLHVIKKPLLQGNFYLSMVLIVTTAAPVFRLRDGVF